MNTGAYRMQRGSGSPIEIDRMLTLGNNSVIGDNWPGLTARPLNDLVVADLDIRKEKNGTPRFC